MFETVKRYVATTREESQAIFRRRDDISRMSLGLIRANMMKGNLDDWEVQLMIARIIELMMANDGSH